MPIKHIVTGQKISQDKLERAKALRQQMTPAECQLWQNLRANRLDGWHFRRQQIIRGFIVDFYCHKAALVIEVDGAIHHYQGAADAERQAVLEQLGLQVLRFSNAQVLENLPHVLEAIREALVASLPSSNPG